jgi:hypothetical protein
MANAKGELYPLETDLRYFDTCAIAAKVFDDHEYFLGALEQIEVLEVNATKIGGTTYRCNMCQLNPSSEEESG